MSKWDLLKASFTGAAMGAAALIFVVGFIVSARFVLHEVGKVMGCAP